MDLIKEAFSKIKEDIKSLRNEISTIQTQLKTISITNPIQIIKQTDRQTDNLHINSDFKHNISSSIGNRGVPTDRQTNQQTDKPTQNDYNNLLNESQKDPISEFKRANEILTSLDNIKNGIRIKFKSLTHQEMLVFSTLYSLEVQKIEEITYRTLANKINLSESSMRDYINKLIKKGVPIDKIRQNNKTILLKISQDLKNVATLDTILHLRGL